MTPSHPSRPQLQTQLAAAPLLTSFAARLLSAQPLNAGELKALSDQYAPSGLPWGRAEGLSREAAEGLADVARRGTLEWLAALGARRLPALAPPQGRSALGRMWEHPAWEGLALSFSSEALTLLIAARQLFCPCPGQDPHSALGALTLTHDGDLLLHALVYERLSAQLRTQADLSALQASFCAASPLCALLDPHAPAPAPARLAASLRALIDRPALPALWPWLAQHIAARWLAAEGRRWPHPQTRAALLDTEAAASPSRGQLGEERRQARERAVACIAAEQGRVEALWAAAARDARGEERLGLLAPLLGYAARVPLVVDGVPRVLLMGALLRGVRLEDRAPLVEPLCALLDLPARLRARAQTLPHILERSTHDEFFASTHAALAFREPPPSAPNAETEDLLRLPLFSRARAALLPEIG